MKILLPLLSVFAFSAGAAPKITYFSCEVTEKSYNVEKKKTEEFKVTVKFAVKGLKVWNKQGELVPYPGSDADWGYVLVSPEESPSGHYPKMANLNGQGGDLRLDGKNVMLFGDGDGYQFTDLVLWDVDGSRQESIEGYVRDYGPAYRGEESFKQFINCQKSSKKL